MVSSSFLIFAILFLFSRIGALEVNILIIKITLWIVNLVLFQTRSKEFSCFKGFPWILLVKESILLYTFTISGRSAADFYPL